FDARRGRKHRAGDALSRRADADASALARGLADADPAHCRAGGLYRRAGDPVADPGRHQTRWNTAPVSDAPFPDDTTGRGGCERLSENAVISASTRAPARTPAAHSAR